MTEPTCPGPDPNPKAPVISLPAGACDAHCHIFGPVSRFPYAEDRTFTPPEAPLADLRRLHDFLGFERSVIVQSACHGTDHSALLDALEQGGGRYRGVALVTPATPDEEIARLHEAGVRGARLHFTPHLGPAPSTETIRAIVGRIEAHGWHIALHVAGDGIAEHEDLVRSLPLPVVIDHMARVDPRSGSDSKAVAALLRLLDSGDVWVKLSGADRIATRPPELGDAVALARLLATEAPDRVVWGTDFPHPNTHGFMPNDGDLVNALAEIAPGEAALRRLLVTNPARCFGF
ncbi:amidohydrolase family protein [Amycolatopsis sp. K13G38]|uniref:Amidohydrolase family protein n=1 Tax=Amycolatopsis acididurans TaxID=2724524 RepID=A0ABX1J4Z6_9PSEU|nr:amidohydrolase family protein [Amycolatopsis acididurans]NKQ54872.1 amidohydrolase family protein [Amycolatopsis acididurans]